MDPISDSSHITISPTAYGVIFRLSLIGVEFAQDIYQELEKIKASQTDADITLLEKMKAPDLTPFFEARYKLVNKLMAQNKNHQILKSQLA